MRERVSAYGVVSEINSSQHRSTWLTNCLAGGGRASLSASAPVDTVASAEIEHFFVSEKEASRHQTLVRVLSSFPHSRKPLIRGQHFHEIHLLNLTVVPHTDKYNSLRLVA